MKSINLALIPARGGSKRLPGKNLKLLNGKPLIAWTIEAALASGEFEQVIVSTDSAEIADVAKAYGAKVPGLRPAELASDEATTQQVIDHVIASLFAETGELSGDKLQSLTLLQPTSPLRNHQHISAAHELFRRRQADAVVSVCELDHPKEFSNYLPADKSLANFIQRSNLKRTQDIAKQYRLNGAIYIYSQALVNDCAQVFDESVQAVAFEMERLYSVDIDEPIDFVLAESIFKYLKDLAKN